MKPLYWNLAGGLLESILWLVGVFWACQAGADIDRGVLKSLRSVEHGVRNVEPVAAPTTRANPTSELRLSGGAGLNFQLEGSTARREMQAAYGRLPLNFEVNLGQAQGAVKFLARGSNYTLLLTATEAIIQLRSAECRLRNEGRKRPNFQSETESQESIPLTPQSAFPIPHSAPRSPQSTIVRMELVGANPTPNVHGEQELAGKSHYFTGKNPTTWRVNIPHYSKVRYRGVYPGVDLVYYGNQRQLEYDFVVAPGGDPRSILLRFAGAVAERGRESMKIDVNGDLVVQTGGGEIRQRKAAAFQDIDGIRHPVFSRYVLRGKREVGFELGSYDVTMPLVIDPVFSYSTTGVGGSAIAVDSYGNAYLVGVASPGFVTTPGAFQPVHGGGTCVNGPNSVPCPDILVTKLSPSGTELIYSTFLGGSSSDYGYAIAVDSTGNAYVTGTTTSTDFPTTPDAFQNIYPKGNCGTTPAAASCNSAFVAKLNATGTALVYSTYLYGGNGGQGGNGIAVDSSGCAYVTGDRGSSGFVTKLNPAGSAPVYSTSDVGGSAIAVDSAGNAYLTGRTKNDSVVTKLNARGSSSLYSFRLGGRSPSYAAPPQEVEALTGIAVDSAGSAYVTGYTAYKDFPTTHGAPFPTAPGAGICGGSLCRDAFVSKLNVAGSALVYSTYLGGNSIDYGNGIAVDSAGNAYVTGVTHSANFPTTRGTLQSTGGGVFVTKLNAAGTALVYSVTLGSGSNNEGGNGIAVDPEGNAYVTGEVGAGFPITPGVVQPPSGSKSSFVAKLFDDMTLFVPVVLSSSGQNGSFFTSELTLTNRAATDATLDLTYTAGFGGGSGRVTDTLAAGRQKVVPDTIAYLKSLGLPIPDSGNRGGTLLVRFSGLTSPSEGAVTVRTTTTVSRGRAGLAYPGISVGLNGPSYLCGLRQNSADQADVVVQNTGSQAQGEITLQLTVFSGNPVTTASRTFQETLQPGGFNQITGILRSNGLSFSNGFVRIERVRGTAPYYAYAVISDQASSDGSFITPVAISSLEGRTGLTLPVVVETTSFSSELVLTNWSDVTKTLLFTFVADGIQARDSAANFAIVLRAREQLIQPNFVQWLRQHSVGGLTPANQSYVGSLFMSVRSGDINGIFLGARTSTAAGGGGRYGVFYPAVPYGMANTASTWLYGLQQNSENRTNLGLVNTGETNGDPDVFRIEMFNGETGLKAGSVEGITLNARRLTQIGSLFEKYAPGVLQGYVRVTRVKGSNPFIAYYVINDGGQPGERSGDGAFVFSAP